MPTPPDDRRPPLVIAMQWVSQITAVALMMVLPAVLGFWGDKSFHTSPWLVIVGAFLGAVLGTLQLMQLVAGENRKNSQQPPRDREQQS